MVLPVDEGDKARMLRIIKKADGSYNEEWFDYFSFVPMLKGKNGLTAYRLPLTVL
jgi:protein-L-isoaspartate(D-aspartate) O-methyltransferase